MPGARWSVALEALWLARSVASGIPLGFTSYNFASHAPQAIPTHSLHTDDVLFPLQTGLRFQVGRQIGDRTAIEATYWGLQHWSIGRTIYGDPVDETVLGYSPWLQVPDLVGGLDDFLAYTYTSEVHNVEINQRIRFDSFNPFSTFTWLWGVRYFHLSDNFTLSGSDLWSGDFETLNYQTRNNLLGMQAGLQWIWGWDRFQLNTEVKVGLFANFYTQQGTDAAVGPAGSPAGFTPLAVSHSDTDLAVLVEVSLLARYRLSPDLWLRLGYQFYSVSGLALAPRQLPGRDAGGAVGLDGLSLGLEWTW